MRSGVGKLIGFGEFISIYGQLPIYGLFAYNSRASNLKTRDERYVNLSFLDAVNIFRKSDNFVGIGLLGRPFIEHTNNAIFAIDIDKRESIEFVPTFTRKYGLPFSDELLVPTGRGWHVVYLIKDIEPVKFYKIFYALRQIYSGVSDFNLVEFIGANGDIILVRREYFKNETYKKFKMAAIPFDVFYETFKSLCHLMPPIK